MKGEYELDQKIWAIVGASMFWDDNGNGLTYDEARMAQQLADKNHPREAFVITTAEAAERALANEQRQKAETV